jgi:CPA2 family monovalent cation:H+ antiporter-2
VVSAALKLNEELRIFSRARFLTERAMLERLGVTEVCYEEAEAAVGIAELLLRSEGADDARVAAEARRIREEFTG